MKSGLSLQKCIYLVFVCLLLVSTCVILYKGLPRLRNIRLELFGSEYSLADWSNSNDYVIKHFVQQTSGEEDIRSESHLRQSSRLLERIGSLNVSLFEREWKLTDVCYKPNSQLIKPLHGEDESFRVFHLVADELSPCLLISPLNCFADRSKIYVNSLGSADSAENSLVDRLELAYERPNLNESNLGGVLEVFSDWTEAMLADFEKRAKNSSDGWRQHIGLWNVSVDDKLYCIDPRHCVNSQDACSLVAQFNYYNRRRKSRIAFKEVYGKTKKFLSCDVAADVEKLFSWIVTPEAEEFVSISNQSEKVRQYKRAHESDILQKELKNNCGGFFDNNLPIFDSQRTVGFRNGTANMLHTEIAFMTPKTLTELLNAGRERKKVWRIHEAEMIFNEWKDLLDDELSIWNVSTAPVSKSFIEFQDSNILFFTTSVFILLGLLLLFVWHATVYWMLFWFLVRTLVIIASYALSFCSPTECKPITTVSLIAIFVSCFYNLIITSSLRKLVCFRRNSDFRKFSPLSRLFPVLFATFSGSLIFTFAFSFTSKLFQELSTNISIVFLALTFGTFLEVLFLAPSFFGYWLSEDKTSGKLLLPTTIFDARSDGSESYLGPLHKRIRVCLDYARGALRSFFVIGYYYIYYRKIKKIIIVVAFALTLSSIAVLLLSPKPRVEETAWRKVFENGRADLFVDVKVSADASSEVWQRKIQQFASAIESITQVRKVMFWPDEFYGYLNRCENDFRNDIVDEKIDVASCKGNGQTIKTTSYVACSLLCGPCSSNVTFFNKKVVRDDVFSASIAAWYQNDINAHVITADFVPDIPVWKNNRANKYKPAKFRFRYEVEENVNTEIVQIVEKIAALSHDISGESVKLSISGALVALIDSSNISWKESIISIIVLPLSAFVFSVPSVKSWRCMLSITTVSTCSQIAMLALIFVMGTSPSDVLYSLPPIAFITTWSISYPIGSLSTTYILTTSQRTTGTLFCTNLATIFFSVTGSVICIGLSLMMAPSFFVTASVALFFVLICAFYSLLVLPTALRLSGIDRKLKKRSKKLCRSIEMAVFNHVAADPEVDFEVKDAPECSERLESLNVGECIKVVPASPSATSRKSLKSLTPKAGTSKMTDINDVSSSEYDDEDESIEDEDEEIRETMRQLRDRWAKQDEKKEADEFRANVEGAHNRLLNLRAEKAEKQKRMAEKLVNQNSRLQQVINQNSNQQPIAGPSSRPPPVLPVGPSVPWAPSGFAPSTSAPRRHHRAHEFPPHFTYEMIEYVLNPEHNRGDPNNFWLSEALRLQRNPVPMTQQQREVEERNNRQRQLNAQIAARAFGLNLPARANNNPVPAIDDDVLPADPAPSTAAGANVSEPQRPAMDDGEPSSDEENDTSGSDEEGESDEESTDSEGVVDLNAPQQP